MWVYWFWLCHQTSSVTGGSGGEWGGLLGVLSLLLKVENSHGNLALKSISSPDVLRF